MDMSSGNLGDLRNQALLEKLEQARLMTARKKAWPERHLVGKDGRPVPYHKAQELIFDSKRRSTAFIAGSQSGKTSMTPWWIWDAIQKSGSGDYIAVTSSFDLFRLKFLPSLLQAFEEILKVGRYWAGDKVIEIADPVTGKFLANRATDRMWARIILRSAQSLGGLESATALAAVLDEAGQPEFPLDAYRAIRRRLLLNRGRMLFTTTLYDLGWVVSEIILPAKKNGETKVITIGDAEIEYTDSEATDTCLVQADSIANPVFPRQEYDEAKIYLPPDQFAMQFRGRVERPRHMIYNCFDEERHLMPRFEIPHHWPRYLGIDFGGANLAGIFIAVDPKTGEAYIYREYHSGNKSAEDHVSDLMFGEPGRPVCYGGAKAEGQWRTEFRQAGLGIREPKVADVWLGINIVYGALKEGYTDHEGKITGRTMVHIFDDLEKLQSQLNSYRRKTDDQGNPIPEEIVAKNSYHLLDSLRYVAPAIFKSHTVMIATA
jgi:hypothetical protein